MSKKSRKMKKNEKREGDIKEGGEILERNLEQFILEQVEKYIRLHKEHEKELKYIG